MIIIIIIIYHMISNLVSYIQHTIVIVSPCVESPDVSGTLNIIGDVENARIKKWKTAK